MQIDLKSAVLRHNRQVPRYTSYPPANFFTPAPPANLIKTWTNELPGDDALSLYVHIPFCPKMCWFCGCHTRATSRYGAVHDYLDLLMREVELAAQVYGRTRLVRHVHFGGGSPTMLTPEDFTRLVQKIRASFTLAPDLAFAVEVDPRQITPEKIRAYARMGVNRISLGVQDIHDDVMRAINRIQPFSLVEHAVGLARGAGLAHINIDLVYGLPHQTPQKMVETVRQVLTLSPDRLALFGYAHVPWMKKHMRLMPEESLPDGAVRYDLFQCAANEIEAHGYVPIGIDHFAQKDDALTRSLAAGTLGRNFQGYIPAGEKMPIVGLGASAISSLPQGYVQNIPEMPQYRDMIEGGKLPTYRYHPLSQEDKIRADVIEQIMCAGAVNLKEICDAHGLGEPESYFGRALCRLAPLVHDGLVAIDHRSESVRVCTRLAIRMAAAAFDAYLPDEAPALRHTAAI